MTVAVHRICCALKMLGGVYNGRKVNRYKIQFMMCGILRQLLEGNCRPLPLYGAAQMFCLFQKMSLIFLSWQNPCQKYFLTQQQRFCMQLRLAFVKACLQAVEVAQKFHQQHVAQIPTIRVLYLVMLLVFLLKVTYSTQSFPSNRKNCKDLSTWTIYFLFLVLVSGH